MSNWLLLSLAVVLLLTSLIFGLSYVKDRRKMGNAANLLI